MNKKKLATEFIKLQKIIKQYNNFLLIIHPSPDADALGSSYSLKKYLETQHKNVTLYSLNLPSQDLKTLFNFKHLTTTLNIHKQDVLIFLDRGDVFYKLNFDKKINRLKNPPKKIINIDHHPHTKISIAQNICSTQAAATSEIIYMFLKYIDFSLTQEMAQYLLNGIYADTGGFRHNNTSPEILEIAGELLRKGASISKINHALFANKSISTLKLWGLALNRVQINKKTGMAVSFITKNDLKKCQASIKDLDGLSEILNTISEAKFSLVLSEREQNTLKASLRSEEYKKIDVSKIARLFKGGGHKLASGFEIKGKLKQTKNGWVVE